jgi:hypothetical protein
MDTIRNKFSFDPQKVDDTIWLLMALVWLVVVGCAIGSVIAQKHRFTKQQKIKWILFILCVPVIGLLAYLPYSLKREGLGILRQQKSKKKKASVAAE